MKMRLHKKISRFLRRKFRNKVLSNHGIGVLADTWNGLLVVEAGDFVVGRHLLKNGAYDKEEIEWLKGLLNSETENIVIVGTHIGSLLIPLSHVTEKITGFEADKTNFEFLSINLKLNKVDNAEITNAAIGAKKGTVEVKRNLINTGNSTIDLQTSTGNNTVNMITLDSTLKNIHIDLMVMDIEGHELHALKGSSNILPHVSLTYIEFAPEHLRNHGSDPLALLDLLGKYFPYVTDINNRSMHTTTKEARKNLEKKIDLHGFPTNLLFMQAQPKT